MIRKLLATSLGFLLFLSGCQAPVYNQTQSNVADTADKIATAKQQMQKKIAPPPALVVNNGAYIDKTPISLEKEPRWLKNRIVLRGDQLPFSYYSRAITGGTSSHVLTRYQVGLDEKLPLSINYTGTVRGALDQIAAKSGYVYSIQGNNVYWQAFITRTYDIAFMPGSSDYMMGKSSSTSGGTSGASGSTGGATSVSAIIDDSAGSMYSNLKGTISLWEDLETSIKQMLSPQGKVVVSQSTTSVTVVDRPSNIALIGHFIENLNNNLSKQVLVKVEVLTVQLENDYSFGINWNVVQSAFNNGAYQLFASNGSPLTISSNVGLATLANTAGVNNIHLNSSKTTANGSQVTGILSLINALQQQGKVSVLTQPQVLCQNNQVSAIRILDSRGYLASIQTTSLSGSSTGGASITSQITPGSVITGVTLYVLPKIMKDKVYLQVNADLSDLISISCISSTGVSSANCSTAATNNGSSIQVPNVQQKQFNQRSVVKSGDTLIMAGFRQVANRNGASQLFDSQALGGKASQQYNTETIILITPIVLGGVG